ncbi:TNF receptor-associated factor 1 isoform X1 [Alosa sapidissima]|uniref:TNF receptor-associated factor 1 isoform X1 n=1 Tax=Alosa sapidissima TaxID=34773 RepID=UPI001C08689E|nr:TNF receptor-associated factor 1 isoform X1 [Alosa sapidissima]
MASRKDITNDVSSTPDENEYPSGFPQSICDQTPHEKYLCSNCNSVLNKARQTACGHRYCLACVNWLVRNNKTPVCKKCKEEEPKADNEASILTLDNSFSDAAITKEILELRVHCANHGCPWRGVLRDFEEHQTQCDYALIPCNVGCGHMVLRKALATHLEKGCPKNTSSCPACSQTLTLAQLPVHNCHRQGDKKPATTEKKQKNGKHAASKEKDSCMFCAVGCTFKGTTEKVREHESSSHVSHLQLLLRAVQSLPPSTSTSSQPPLALPSQLSSPGAGSLDPLLEVDGGEGGGGRCQEEMSLAHSLREDQAAAAAAVVGQQLDSVQERVCVFENIISALSREVEKAQLCMAALERDHHSNQDVINFLKAKIAEQQQRLVMKEGLVSALQLRVSALQEVSYDGTFLWRVPDINQKLQEAAQGQRSSLYSPAFYTSRYGFKVCLRLYLNGDGVGRGTHISLFFVIMRGEYDALLTWPFRHKVTFFLIDQNQREHVLDAFRPDLSSASFKRPTSDMNVASGCPCFCPLSKLSSPKYAYCKGNTLFVKCVVDTSS